MLRHAARIGDLREAGLGGSAHAAAVRSADGVGDEATVLHALQVACWINSIERSRFSPPYVDKDADAKHEFFLQRLGAALTPEGIEALRPVRRRESSRGEEEAGQLWGSDQGRPHANHRPAC